MKNKTMREKMRKHLEAITEDILLKLDPHSSKYDELRKLLRELDIFRSMYIGD